MGSGKSTVGRRLAQKLHTEFVDMDAYIEQTAGIGIPEIFSRFGQSYFRDLEHEALKTLCARSGLVIATGGGAMTFARNVQAVPAQDRIILLDTGFQTCYERIKSSDRPLVRENSEQQLRDIFDVRRGAYRKAAAFIVDAGGCGEEVAGRILHALQGASEVCAED